MFPYKSMLQPLFDQYMLELYQTGLIDRIFQSYQPWDTKCIIDGFNQVDLNFVLMMFAILGFGVILSGICLVFEMLGYEILKLD